jgi:hypothetical protein
MTPRRKPTRPGDRASQRAQAFASDAKAAAVQRDQAKAARAAQAEAEFASQITTVRLNIYQLADGDDATRILAALAVVIGTPAEAGARTYGRDPAWVRQLHGALRGIVDMCLQGGYRWRTDMAAALDRAVEIAVVRPDHLPAEHFESAWLEANALAVQILSHSVTEGAIA